MNRKIAKKNNNKNHHQVTMIQMTNHGKLVIITQSIMINNTLINVEWNRITRITRINNKKLSQKFKN
jgi:hypothetical protein